MARKHVVGQFGALNHLNTAQILPMEFIVVRGRDDQHVWIHHAGQWRNIEVRKASCFFFDNIVLFLVALLTTTAGPD